MPVCEVHWTLQAGYPMLATLQLLPLAAMSLMLLIPAHRHLQLLALTAAMLELLLALDLTRQYNPTSPLMQFAEHQALLGPFAYHAAADGMTVMFVLLNAFLTLLVLLYSIVLKFDSIYRFFAAVFVLEAILMSQLVTVDLLWFVLASAAQLLPIGYLLWRWSHSPLRDLALTRFHQFLGMSVLLLLTGALILGWNHAEVTGRGWSFDLFALAQLDQDPAIRSVVFFLLFYGIAIRTPLFPLHGWLPLLAEHGTLAAAPVFLLGLKTGIYGLLRFVFPLMPDAVLQWHQFIVAFAAAGIFYAALLALLQVNLRRLLAFAVISHTSVLVIGLFSLGALSFAGSVILTLNFGLAITGLLLMTGLIHKRTDNTLLTRLGGLFDRLPLIGITFLIATLAIIGMPGTPGFDAVHLVLEDAMHRFGALVTIAAALGNVVAAGFLLWAFQRAFLAPARAGKLKVECTTATEQLIAVLLICVLLGSGFYSEPWLVLIEQATQRLSAGFG